MALVSMSPRGRELDEAARAQLVADIVRDSDEVVRRHSGPNGFTYEITAVVATGRA